MEHNTLKILEAYDWIFIVTIVVAVLSATIISIISGRRKSTETDGKKDNKSIVLKRNMLLKSSIVWLSIYYWIVLTSILATIYVIYITSFTSNAGLMQVKVFVYSCFSLFASVSLFVIDPKRNSEKYRAAFMVLDKCLNRLDYDTCLNDDPNTYKEITDTATAGNCKNNSNARNLCIINALDECEEIINEAHR